MNDRIIQLIRTFWPGAIAWLIAQAVAQIPAVADWIAYVDDLLVSAGWGATAQELLTAAAIGATIAGYVALVQWLSKLPKIGHWIARLGLGSSKTPTYRAIAPVPTPVNIDAESDGFLLALELGAAQGLTREQVWDRYVEKIRGGDGA
ncbi:hypothetical protein ABIQ69_11595 [Agromyces sp. G08B096]|uniref:Uncharacterized protein n=1 Tax=Agromyces sp. G08B096 TaxID=3156399 RepID=A0AAU7W3S5_9MICO